MKRRHHSTIEKKPAAIIHTIIRSSHSLRTTSNKSIDHDKDISSVSVTRHHRNGSRKISIAPVPKEIVEKRKSSMINIQTDADIQYSSELQKNIIKTNDTTENSQRQSIYPSQSMQQTIQNSQINAHENIATLVRTSFESNKPDQIQINTPSTQITSTNDHTDIQKTDNRPVQKDVPHEYHRKSKLKHRRKFFCYNCCSCSRICATISVFAILLLSTAMAAIIIALLNKNKEMIMTISNIVITSTTSTMTTSTLTSSTTTTISTTSETTTTPPKLSIGTNDTLQGIWNTTAGGDSTKATPGNNMGNYVSGEGPENAFDGNCNNKYLNFGECAKNAALNSLVCGRNTGFHATLHKGAAVMTGLRFCTGNDASQRDPITMTLEGSNENGTALLLGSSWTLIYNGSCGLNADPGRKQFGQRISFFYNVIAYSSYRILITSKRGSEHAVQYGEMELFGS